MLGKDEYQAITISTGLAKVGVLLGEEEYRHLFMTFDYEHNDTLEFMDFFNIVSGHKMDIDARTKFITGKIKYSLNRQRRNWRRKKMNLPVPKAYKKPVPVHPWVVRCHNLPRILWDFSLMFLLFHLMIVVPMS